MLGPMTRSAMRAQAWREQSNQQNTSKGKGKGKGQQATPDPKQGKGTPAGKWVWQGAAVDTPTGPAKLTRKQRRDTAKRAKPPRGVPVSLRGAMATLQEVLNEAKANADIQTLIRAAEDIDLMSE